MSDVSILFPVFNRLVFTRESWSALMSNTNWHRVTQVHIFDDGSTDGSLEWIEEHRHDCPVRTELVRTSFRSSMAVTVEWIKRARTPFLAKLDNDTIYPPGWLDAAMSVMDRNPQLDMLGLEAFHPLDEERHLIDGFAERYNYEAAYFVSGLGVYRSRIWERELPAVIKGRDGAFYGLEEFQYARPNLVRGWIKPSLPVFLLDRLPMEPWASLNKAYVQQCYQRPLSLRLTYGMDKSELWDWWTPRYVSGGPRAVPRV